ncbi:MAG TPA: FtsX-like permease family protein [Pirellulales bacterium]|jgi:ABC-type lipoprotein release transport system permease subunit|nr:FtsX-like permease family protein [Pirellulales bacterium]
MHYVEIVFSMGSFRFILRSLTFHRRIHVAVALGVMAATAVLTGALLVGDSVRGSLRHLTLDRLGRIDAAIVTPRFFRAELADEISAYRDPERPQARIIARPAILLQATLAHGRGAARRSVGQVAMIGCDESFWDFDPAGPHPRPGSGQIVLNESLADQLGATVGDNVIVRLPLPSDIPAESALGRKTETVRSLPALKVSAIIPATGLGRFGLRPTQQLPHNAYVAISTLQKALDQPDRVNAILAGIDPPSDSPSPADDEMFERALHPKLADYGLSLRETPRGYFNLTTDRMLLDEPIERAAERAFGDLDGQPTFTYLANYILAANGKAKIPYSTVTALDLRGKPPLGPFRDADGKAIEPLKDDEILLNSWAADDMAKQGAKLKPGDTIQLQYFEPESLHGEATERTADFRLKAIVELDGAAADPNLTPELKGVTDKKSIANWNPPFKFYPDRVRSRAPHNEDDLYWQKYHATPKAFVSLATGRRLWSSRFGDTTTWRIPPRSGTTVESLTNELEAKLDPAKLGFEFLPVKRLGLMAASGTTPFNLLFLGFSFFIIAAAVMLVALLFKLGIDGRAGETGALLAMGFSRGKIRRLLAAEGFVVSLIGGLLGVAAGLSYAWLMIEGLRTWWLAAVVTPFLQLYVTGESLLIGFAAGVLVSLMTIALALRQQNRVSVRRLLSGEPSEPIEIGRRQANWVRIGGVVALVLAIALVTLLGGRTSGEEQAGVFFASGFLVLSAMLALVWDQLRSDRGAARREARGTLSRLAVRNGARHPLRSTLTIGLMAAASFLIVSISAFRLEPPREGASLHSGDGGFSLYAETDQPIYQDLNTIAGREDLSFDAEAEKLLAGTEVIGLRAQAGDDASCLNLYQPRQPRILGVTPELVKHDGFEWSGSSSATPQERENPWLLLDAPVNSNGDTPAVPVVLDENTATYSLHLGGVGSIYEITDSRGRQTRLQVVGLLKNSLFQGDLLMRETDLLLLFPETSGQRVFLIDTRQQRLPDVRQAMDSALGDYGFDAEPTSRRLDAFMAVQNTYLSTFQSLGGLGLLLGTVGLAVVQLRSVLERRGELALMRAVGFRRRRLAGLVMLENTALLLAGLLTGIIAALVAILPQLIGGSATTPWLWLAGTLILVLVVGLSAGLLAVRATLRAPLIPALREE